MRNAEAFTGLNERGRSGGTFLDRLVIVFLFLIPLVPRPTMTGAFRLAAPAFVFFVAYFYFIWFAARKAATGARGRPMPVAPVLIVSGIISLFLLRIVLASEWNELEYLVSKVLSLTLILVIASWLSAGRSDIEAVFRTLFYGFVALSVIVIFVSVTGIPLFGEVRPNREFLLPVRVFKTTGVPRSYGEQGIFATTAISYILVYRKNYGRFAFAALLSVVVAATLASQSRSVYLAAFAVLVLFFMLQSRFFSKFSSLALLGLMLIPFIISFGFDLISSMSISEIIMGEDIFRSNVINRVAANRTAANLILRDPQSFILGIGHAEWGGFLYDAEGLDIALHNHFFSSLVFLGIIGGSLNLLLYLIPLWRLAFSDDRQSREFQVLALSFVGLIINLQFYEGFFSMIVAVLLGVCWHACGSLSGRA